MAANEANDANDANIATALYFYSAVNPGMVDDVASCAWFRDAHETDRAELNALCAMELQQRELHWHSSDWMCATLTMIQRWQCVLARVGVTAETPHEIAIMTDRAYFPLFEMPETVDAAAVNERINMMFFPNA